MGYGDVKLETKAEKWFVILFVMAALFTLSAGVNIIMESIEQEKVRAQRVKLLGADLDMATILEMDKGIEDVSGVDEMTFLISILIKLDVLDRKLHVDPWRKKFKEYDRDGSGILDHKDIVRMQHDREKEKSEKLASIKHV